MLAHLQKKCISVIRNWKRSVIECLAVFVISGATSLIYKKNTVVMHRVFTPPV